MYNGFKLYKYMQMRLINIFKKLFVQINLALFSTYYNKIKFVRALILFVRLIVS